MLPRKMSIFSPKILRNEEIRFGAKILWKVFFASDAKDLRGFGFAFLFEKLKSFFVIEILT